MKSAGNGCRRSMRLHVVGLVAEMAGEDEPLFLDGHSRAGHRLFGPEVPVGGVFRIPFLAVEVGVDPRAFGIGNVLNEVVGLVPAAGAGEPQRAQGVGEFGGRVVRFAGGLVELFGIHDERVEKSIWSMAKGGI